MKNAGATELETISQAIFKFSDVNATNGCWEWIGPCYPNGYGHYLATIRGNVHQYAHRAFYTLLVGDITGGATLDHLCHNRRCINPEHLECVTPYENAVRQDRSMKELCIRGHELSGDNLYLEIKGNHVHRHCRICRIERSAKQHAAEREARRLAKAARKGLP